MACWRVGLFAPWMRNQQRGRSIPNPTETIPYPVNCRCCRCRRDLDAARLLADQVRRREKLKKQELRLFQQEWAARMSGALTWQPMAAVLAMHGAATEAGVADAGQ